MSIINPDEEMSCYSETCRAPHHLNDDLRRLILRGWAPALEAQTGPYVSEAISFAAAIREQREDADVTHK